MSKEQKEFRQDIIDFAREHLNDEKYFFMQEAVL